MNQWEVIAAQLKMMHELAKLNPELVKQQADEILAELFNMGYIKEEVFKN